MPYGVAKALGGDSPENDAHMESMVAALQREGHDKISAIRIAKASMTKNLKPKSDPRMSAINDLHKMLSGAIASHMKAKKAPAPVIDQDGADDPETENTTPDSAQEEASENQLTAKNKKRFGPGHKK